MGNDDVSLSGGTATFSNKIVEIGKTVTLDGARLSGVNAGNYSLTSVSTTTADITQRTLTVSATGINKVYDGTTDASVNLSDNRVAGDILTLSYTSASFLDPNAGNSKQVDVSGIDVTGTDAENYTWNTSTSTSANITEATTQTTLTTSAPSVRFMDYLTMTARVKPLNTGSLLTGEVEFFIGTKSYGSVVAVPIPDDTDGRVQATIIPQVSDLPGSYTVKAVFKSSNTNYSGSQDTKPLTVVAREASPYDAKGFYVGDLFAWTTGPNSSTGTVAMVAKILDANVPAGDVRGAKVTFYLVNGTSFTPIPGAQNLPVGLINVDDGTIGFASAIVQLNIGSGNAQSFQVAVGISGAYKNNLGSALAQTIVTVSKPVTGGYIVGGSQLENVNSAGYIRGHSGLYTDYQFDIQYTKSGTNPKGKVRIMIRSYYRTDGTLDSVLHTYIVTTNAIALLNVGSPTATGTFSAKANLVEQLPNLTTVNIEGGATFNMVAFQKDCAQRIAITLYRKAGGIWFSSNWDGTSTKQQQVSEGSRVYVAGGGSCANANGNAGFVVTGSVKSIPEEYSLSQNYPNPFNPTTEIKFDLPKDSFVRLAIFDVIGREVAELVNEEMTAGYQSVSWSAVNNYGVKFGSGIYFYRIEAKPLDGGERFTDLKKMILIK